MSSARLSTQSSTASAAASVVAPSVATTASVVAPSVATPVDAPETESKKSRRVVSCETVMAHFETLRVSLDEQIELVRKNNAEASKKPVGATGIKFLRSVRSELGKIQKDVLRVVQASSKRPKRVSGNKEGGFLKPQVVTKDMADFAGWSNEEMKSRVDVTNAICAYVKTNNLQDPACKKNILPDEKLRNLLKYDPTVAGNDPLTYFYLQKLIGPLLVKSTPAAK